jgi:hypothetical protein
MLENEMALHITYWYSYISYADKLNIRTYKTIYIKRME